MKKFFGLIVLCLLTLFLTTIFSCSNSSDNSTLLALLTAQSGTKQTDNTNSGGTEEQPSGQTAQPSFLTDWETMEFLYINDNGTLDKKIEAPWNKEAASTIMPESVRMDVKKEDGWEAAFNLMNKDGHPDMNYFGLYNKYTGVLRIFYYYNKEVASSATDFAFEIVFETDGLKNQSYYNALNYGIPMDADIKSTLNFLVEGNTSNTFRILTTPYSCSDRHEMIQGWYAFDIDMSTYTGKSFYTEGSTIVISCRANNKTSVTLSTDILGKIGGTLNGAIDKTKMQSSSNGTSATLSDIADGSSSIGKAFNSTADALDKKGPAAIVAGIGAAFHWVSSVFKIGSIATKKRSESAQQQEQHYKINGKLDLRINATAATQGYLESSASTNVKQFTLEKVAFNPNSNVGKGVWNIDKSPEVYFFPETIFASHEIAYFYDPTSFKVILNKDVFPDATNLKIISYCGVYARDGNETADTAFREAIGLGKTPSLENNKANTLTTSDSYSRDFYPLKLSEDLDSSSFQSGAFSYEGYTLKLDDQNSAFNFILEPHIVYQNSKAWPERYPQLYVVVVVLFESNGKKFIFSRTYLPKMSEISVSKAQEMKADIDSKFSEQLYKDEYMRVMNDKFDILEEQIINN